MSFFNLPTNDFKNQVFYNTSVTTWTKPQGISMVYILAIGAGGGGGLGGNSGGINTIGGGGGGSGGMSRLIIPASIIPEYLNITVGLGGRGGINTTDRNGLAGGTTIVQLPKGSGVAANYVLVALGGGGGTNGVQTGAAGAAAGLAGSTNMTYSTLGIFTSIGGQAGSAGGNTTNGSNVTFASLIPISGGAGGGGASTTTPFSGGSIVGSGIVPTLSGGIAGANGQNGFSLFRPFYQTGGSGGGGTVSASGGGAAGNGSIGCGGGGGGAGYGLGGRGGDGLVIISCW